MPGAPLRSARLKGGHILLGHRAIIDRLWDAMERGSLHHAYLFEGPSGVGKHTLAQQLAMAANCTAEVPPADRPCGQCGPCKQIASGSHPDVITVTPDPSRATPIISVDQIREVVRLAGYHRYNSKRRFVLIDPAEGMAAAAANALLKTLEEPPEGTGFILIANHASALLPTIVSRCQRVRFSSVPAGEITSWLMKREVTAADAGAAARLSLGCPGQALALVDGGLKARSDTRGALLQALAGGASAVFKFTESATKGRRQDWMQRAEALIRVVEDLLRDVVVMEGQSGVALLNKDLPEVVRRWHGALWPTGVARCQEAIVDARRQLQLNVQGRVVLDALLLTVREELGAAAR